MQHQPPIQLRRTHTPLGTFILGATDHDRLCLCSPADSSHWLKLQARFRQQFQFIEHCTTSAKAILKQAEAELNEYLQGARSAFTVVPHPIGTAFQMHVWDAVSGVPYGETRSYKTIARSIMQPTAVRAVANAIGSNPLLVFIPCHRVIGCNGSLTGYAGGLALKDRLLKLEQPLLPPLLHI